MHLAFLLLLAMSMATPSPSEESKIYNEIFRSKFGQNLALETSEALVEHEIVKEADKVRKIRSPEKPKKNKNGQTMRYLEKGYGPKEFLKVWREELNT